MRVENVNVRIPKIVFLQRWEFLKTGRSSFNGRKTSEMCAKRKKTYVVMLRQERTDEFSFVKVVPTVCSLSLEIHAAGSPMTRTPILEHLAFAALDPLGSFDGIFKASGKLPHLSLEPSLQHGQDVDAPHLVDATFMCIRS